MAGKDPLDSIDREGVADIVDLLDMKVDAKPTRPIDEKILSGGALDQRAMRSVEDRRRSDAERGVGYFAEQVRQAAVSVELPAGATHKLIGTDNVGAYVRVVKLEYAERTVLVELVGGIRGGNKMHVPARFLALGNGNVSDSALMENMQKGPDPIYDTSPETNDLVGGSKDVASSLRVYFGAKLPRVAKVKPSAKLEAEINPEVNVEEKTVPKIEPKPEPKPEVKPAAKPKAVAAPKLSKEEIVAAHVEPLLDCEVQIINDGDYPNQRVEILGFAKDDVEMIWVKFLGGRRDGSKTKINYKNLAKVS